MAENIYTVQESSLIGIADAIRTKAGKDESEKLAFPNGFVSAIESITPVTGGSLTVLTGQSNFSNSTSLSSVNITLERAVEKIIGFCIYTTNTSFPSYSMMGGTTYNNNTLLQLSTFYYNSGEKRSDISVIKATTSSGSWGGTTTTYSRETSNTENTYPYINESGGQNVFFSDNNSYVLSGTYNWIALVEPK